MPQQIDVKREKGNIFPFFVLKTRIGMDKIQIQRLCFPFDVVSSLESASSEGENNEKDS
jgi:hypothetical protein